MPYFVCERDVRNLHLAMPLAPFIPTMCVYAEIKNIWHQGFIGVRNVCVPQREAYSVRTPKKKKKKGLLPER